MSQTKAVRAVPQRKPSRGANRLAGRETAPEQITHPELEAENELEKLPPAIQHGRIAVNYLKPHFEHDAKTDKRTVGLELSLELREEHQEVIPKEIRNWWDLLKGGGVKSMALLGVPMQYIELGIAPEKDADDFEIKAAPIQKVSLAVIEKEGEGTPVEAIRLTFRVMVDLTPSVEKFACRNFGETLWLRMQAVQGSLL